MVIPCGHGLGAGITLVAGFPFAEEFLNFFYENIYSQYGHYIDFQGRQDDFGSLHVTIFGITGTKRGDEEGRSCRVHSQDRFIWNLQRERVPLDLEHLISTITDISNKILRIQCFTLNLVGATVERNSNNVRLSFQPALSNDEVVVNNLLKIPDEIGLKAKKRTGETSILHCTIGRVRVPFCDFKMIDKRLFEDKIEEEIKEIFSSLDKPAKVTIDRLKIVHYRRSSMLGLNGYIVIPLSCNTLINNQIVKDFLNNKTIVQNMLGIE